MLKHLVCGLVVFCCSGTSFAYIVDGSRINRPKLLDYAKERMENHGIVQQEANGFTYLKLPLEYIVELVNQARHPELKLPSYNHEGIKNEARISVIAAEEAKSIKKLQELGKVIHFKPLGFYTRVDHDKEYLMLAVDAPELSDIRLKYGLSEKLANHAFSIVVGVRQLTAENELEP